MRATTLLLLAVAASGCAGTISRIESPVFDEEIDAYMEIRRGAVDEVGRVHPTESARRISADVKELARAIRERRPNAVEGDIFTPEVAAAFRAALRQLVESEDGPLILNRVSNPESGTARPGRERYIRAQRHGHRCPTSCSGSSRVCPKS